jgi:hypothetical protein
LYCAGKTSDDFTGLDVNDQFLKRPFMKLYQQALQLKARRRGFHIITTEIQQAMPQLREINAGMC